MDRGETMNIFWAVVIIVLNKVTVLEVAQTREGCEAIAKQVQGASCHPVNVKAKYDAQKQIDAINELIK